MVLDIVVFVEVIVVVFLVEVIVVGDFFQIVYMVFGSVLWQEYLYFFFYMLIYVMFGYGFFVVIGVVVVQMECLVVIVIGDGVLMFCVNEFVIVVEQCFDVIVVCVDNGGYVEIWQNEFDCGMVFVGVDFVQFDWVVLVMVFGVIG